IELVRCSVAFDGLVEVAVSAIGSPKPGPSVVVVFVFLEAKIFAMFADGLVELLTLRSFVHEFRCVAGGFERLDLQVLAFSRGHSFSPPASWPRPNNPFLLPCAMD